MLLEQRRGGLTEMRIEVIPRVLRGSDIEHPATRAKARNVQTRDGHHNIEDARNRKEIWFRD